MAKYCFKCGRKLEEGEVCDCQTLTANKIDFGESINKLINLVKGMFTSPVKVMKEFKDEKNFSLAIILVIITSIFAGLFTMLLVKQLYLETVNTYTIGSYSVMQTVEIPYFKIFITSFLISVLSYFVEAVALFIVNNQIFKVNCTCKNTFNIVSALSSFVLIGAVLSIIGIFISIYVSIVILGICAILNMICLVMANKDIFKLNDKNTMYSIILYLVIMTIISYIIFLLLK